MSGISWIILDLLLALVAIGGTVKVASTPPPKPLAEKTLEVADEKPRATENAPEKSVAAGQNTAHPDALPANASLDDLWRNTLFLPTRAEAEPGDTEAEAAAAAALASQNFEFELVGIAQISPANKPPVPVAVLRSKSAAARNQPRTRQPGRPQNTAPQPTTPTAAAPKKPPEKLIFKEGDPINATGYLLKAIYPDKRMVEVSRGNETLKLYINYAGEEATKRRAEMTAAAAEKRAAAEKKAAAEEASRQSSIREQQAQQEAQRQAEAPARNAANPGMPPPPPGMDGNGGMPPTPSNGTPRTRENSTGDVPATIPENGTTPSFNRSLRNRVENTVRQRTTQPGTTAPRTPNAPPSPQRN